MFYQNLKSIFTFGNLKEAFQGFNRSSTTNISHNYVRAMEQGASPNSLMVRVGEVQASAFAGSNVATVVEAMKFTKTSWLVTPFMLFLPIITNGWPRQGEPNDKFNQTTAFLRRAAHYCKHSEAPWYRRGIGHFLHALHWLLDHLPHIRNRYLLRFFDLINKIILPLSTAITIAAYITMYFYGFSVMAAVGACTLGLGVLDRYNLLPNFLRNAIRKWGIHISLLGGLIFGGPLELAISLVLLPIYYGHHFKGVFTWLLARFSMTRELVATLQAQNAVVNTFDFKVTANQFQTSLTAMNQMDCSIIRAHVADNNSLLPPANPTVELDDLTKLFNSIDWKKEKKLVVELNRKMDWRLMREAVSGKNKNTTPAAQYERDIQFLKNNLTTFINRIKQGDVHSVRVGTEDLLKRYTSAIIVVLKEIKAQEKNPKLTTAQKLECKSTLLDTLVRLGYETGEYCGIGLLRAVESNYRSLHANNRNLTLKDRIRFIHQMHRELFFQKQYVKRRLNLGDNLDDTHAYARSVMFYAPRLGLPAQFAEHDEVNNFGSAFISDLFSAMSPVEKRFWSTHLTVDRLKKQIRDSLNTPLLPLADITSWYHQFIDNHVEGTEAERDALKEDLPYTMEMHGAVPIYKLKEPVINLMLLDFGVIALPGRPNIPQNSFNVQQSKSAAQGNAVKPFLHSAARHPNRRVLKAAGPSAKIPQVRLSR